MFPSKTLTSHSSDNGASVIITISPLGLPALHFHGTQNLDQHNQTQSLNFKAPSRAWQLPLIGNMHQLISSSLTHQTLTNLAQKHGPLMHLRLGEVSTIVVSSPETAEQICITEALSSKRVETFRGIREEEAMNFIRDISLNTGSAINLSKRIFSHTSGVTARAAFGKKSRDQEEFIEVMDEALKLFGGFSVADMYPSVKLLQVMSGMRRKLEKLHKRVDQILENIVNEHRQRKMERESGRGEAEDLVDVLLRVQKGGDLEFPLTDDNIKAVILVSFLFYQSLDSLFKS
ncbi:hypothetical protein CsSME_00026058 [Camellia sinensis var. sinensis]